MRVSAEQEAVAEAIFKSMRRVRISWANLDRVGLDHYRKAAKAALRAIATKTTKSEA